MSSFPLAFVTACATERTSMDHTHAADAAPVKGYALRKIGPRQRNFTALF